MFDELARSLRFTILAMVCFGGVYPVALWAVGRLAFPAQMEGSLVRDQDGRVVGSHLIAQRFTRAEYFHPRPSAVEHDGASTGGSNDGPSKPDHLGQVRSRLETIVVLEGTSASRVPAEMVTASGSGVDPHIPPEAAELQAPRVARARSVHEDRVRRLVEAHIEPPTLGLLGRARINVLDLNVALDQAFGPPSRGPRRIR